MDACVRAFVLFEARRMSINDADVTQAFSLAR